MAFQHSKVSVLKIQDAAGTLQNVTIYVTKCELPRVLDKAETSTLGSTYKSYVVGLADASFSVEFEWDVVLIGWLDGILGNTSRTFEYGPGGNTASSGMPKYTGTLFMTSFREMTDISAELKASCDFQVTGAITVAAY